MLRGSRTLRGSCRRCIRAIPIGVSRSWPRCGRRSSLRFRLVPGLRLVVTYGWEGLRTWDSGPAWQEHCDQVEAEVRGRFAGYDVIFTGRLSKPALASVLMQSDVCLYPCNFFETFCLTALECQAAGVPMVTSEFGALATTLAPGAGVKIPGHPNSPAYRRQFVRAAVDVLQDAERRRAMGAAGVVHVAGGPFGWLDVAEQWRRLEWELPRRTVAGG